MALVDDAKQDLEALYSSQAEDKGPQKQARLDRLRDAIVALYEGEGRRINDDWLAQPFNNARIASMVLYEGQLPAFRELLDDCRQDLECFYADAERLSELSLTERYAAQTTQRGSGAVDEPAWFP